MGDALAFWLIPTHESRAWFTEQIRTFTERFGSASFEPHLTVHVGPEHGIAAPASVLAEASFEFAPITVKTTGIGHSDVFTKTLYVNVELSQELLDLQSKLRDRLPSDYVLSPHISIAYHELSENERAELAAKLTPPAEVTFAVLQAVRCRIPSVSADDVRSWEILEEWHLAPPLFDEHANTPGRAS